MSIIIDAAVVISYLATCGGQGLDAHVYLFDFKLHLCSILSSAS